MIEVYFNGKSHKELGLQLGALEINFSLYTASFYQIEIIDRLLQRRFPQGTKVKIKIGDVVYPEFEVKNHGFTKNSLIILAYDEFYSLSKRQVNHSAKNIELKDFIYSLISPFSLSLECDINVKYEFLFKLNTSIADYIRTVAKTFGCLTYIWDKKLYIKRPENIKDTLDISKHIWDMRFKESQFPMQITKKFWDAEASRLFQETKKIITSKKPANAQELTEMKSLTPTIWGWFDSNFIPEATLNKKFIVCDSPSWKKLTIFPMRLRHLVVFIGDKLEMRTAGEECVSFDT